MKDKKNTGWLEKAIDSFDAGLFSSGDVLTHAWIEKALDIPAPENVEDFQRVSFTLLHRFKTFESWILEERKIALKNVRGFGYQIVPPSEQAHFGASEAMKGVRKGLERGQRIMDNTNFMALTAEESKRHTDATIRLAGIGDMMRKQRRNLFELITPSGKLTQSK